MNIPIFLSADNNYAPFIATTIASICDNTQSFCNFYVLDGGISKENQEKICEIKNKFSNFSIEFININVDKYFDKYPNSLHYSKTMYSRFLIPEIKPELNKVLYSDVDVICLKDIKEMFDEDIEDYDIGAVPELFLGTKLKQTYLTTLSLSPEHQPFASGNLIIDCDKWRQKNLSKKIMEIDLKKQDTIKYVDQTIMNIFFENNYKKLNQRYCYTIQHDVCLPSEDVVICHFNGMVKPWQINRNQKTKDMPYLKKFWEYAEITTFYEELNIKTSDETLQNNLLKQLRIFRIMAKRNFNS